MKAIAFKAGNALQVEKEIYIKEYENIEILGEFETESEAWAFLADWEEPAVETVEVETVEPVEVVAPQHGSRKVVKAIKRVIGGVKKMDKGTCFAMMIVGVIMGLLIAGIGKGSTPAPAPTSQKIVASQLAYDGELQVTYEDGSSQTIWVDMPNVYYEEPALYEEGSEVLENGKTLYHLSNGLEALVYHPEGVYELYLPFMGDHSLEYNSIEALTWGVLQYSQNHASYINEVINKDQQ